MSGTVKEAWIDTGLPGASVTIASGPSAGSTVTNEQGEYTLGNLLPGIYRVTFSKGAPYGAVTYGPVGVFAESAMLDLSRIPGNLRLSLAVTGIIPLAVMAMWFQTFALLAAGTPTHLSCPGRAG